MGNKKAFTLIELLVVVAVIGLLSSIVLVSVKDARKDAELKRVMQFSSSIQHSLGAYAIGIWSFENNLIDSSGNGNTGELLGGAPGGYDKGVINRAIKFDTTKGYVHIPLSSKLVGKSGAITLEFWVYVEDFAISGLGIPIWYSFDLPAPVEDILCSYSTTGQFSCAMTHPTDGDINFGFEPGSPLFLKANEWQHVVLTYDGKDNNSAKLFLNTKEIAPSLKTFSPAVISDGNAELYIGGNSLVRMKGMMDEVRLYDQYISLSGVRKHYVEGLYKIGLRELALNI